MRNSKDARTTVEADQEHLASALCPMSLSFGGRQCSPCTRPKPKLQIHRREFLSKMLGVRRTSVTEVASKIQATGAISYSGHAPYAPAIAAPSRNANGRAERLHRPHRRHEYPRRRVAAATSAGRCSPSSTASSPRTPQPTPVPAPCVTRGESRPEPEAALLDKSVLIRSQS
jgi:hypothetical protein